MVSAQTILILGGLALFLFAGGIGISKTAFAQARTDLSTLTGGISERVKNISLNKMNTSNNSRDQAGETIF